MRDAHVAAQAVHVALAEHIAHQPLAAHREQLAAIGGHDARGILAAVLQHRQRVIQLLVDRTASGDACNATHALSPPVSRPAPAERAGNLRPLYATGWPLV